MWYITRIMLHGGILIAEIEKALSLSSWFILRSFVDWEANFWGGARRNFEEESKEATINYVFVTRHKEIKIFHLQTDLAKWDKVEKRWMSLWELKLRKDETEVKTVQHNSLFVSWDRKLLNIFLGNSPYEPAWWLLLLLYWMLEIQHVD